MPEPPRLPCWVVTGPIGAGKSTAVAELARLGAAVVDADAAGHAVLAEPEVAAAVAARYGPDAAPGGVVDRAAVARRVFADPAELAWLEALTHPRLSRRIAAALAALARRRPRPPLAVVEAAVYFRLPPWGPVDLVIAVTAPEEVRIRRLVASGRFTADEARRRVAAQRSLLPRFAAADVVIDNGGDAASLRAAVRRLWRERGPGADPDAEEVGDEGDA